jgi:phosphoglycerate dehydrogenase-like enzyme
MRVLVADRMDLAAPEELGVRGLEIASRPDLTGETLDVVGILVVRSTEVSGEAIAAGKQLDLIVRAGAGVNTPKSVFEGTLATCPERRTSGRASEACLNEIAAFAEALHVDLVALPNLA